MKTRVNLTIEDELLTHVKAYAASKRTSVSELVEQYFKTLAQAGRKKNIIHLVEKLKRPSIKADADLKDQFYQDQAGKYGF